MADTVKQLRDKVVRLEQELHEVNEIIRSNVIAKEALRMRLALERIAVDEAPENHGRWHVDIAREALRDDLPHRVNV